MPALTEGITVNASTGDYVDVVSTIVSRKVVITEDAAVPVGLQYKLPKDGFTAVHTLAAGSDLVLGNTVCHQNNAGPILGFPAQATIAATVLAKLLSVGIATTYRKVEIE